MTPYRVFIFPTANDQEQAFGESVRFVTDKTNIWALLIALPWMLWNRLWLVALGYLALATLLQLLGLVANEQIISAFALLTAFLIAIEAPTLKAETWKRNGWQEVDIVMADTLEEAEIKYFHSLNVENHWQNTQTEPMKTSKPVPAKRTVPKPLNSAVLGLFPAPDHKHK